MDNLTLAEINQLLIDAGETVQVDSSKFVQVNASNEAQYVVTYDEGTKTNHVFVYQLGDTLELSFSEFDDDDDDADAPDIGDGDVVITEPTGPGEV